MSTDYPLLTDFRLTRPILQAPIGSLSTVEFAAGASNAGGMRALARRGRSLISQTSLVGATMRLTRKPFLANLSFPAEVTHCST